MTRIIAYEVIKGTGGIYPTLMESSLQSVKMDSFDNVASFLLEPYENSMFICWDLDAMAAAILKLVNDKDRLAGLQVNRKCYIPPFNIFYVPGKVFSISHIPSKLKVNIYGLQQYYPELKEPDNVTEIQILGEKLLYELNKMGLKPTKLTSPVAIYEECIMGNMSLPQVKDMPLDAATLAYYCSGSLWIEAHQLGYWDHVYDYDLSSAFPTVAKDLIDFRYCKWIQSRYYVAGAIYGYTRCQVSIDDDVMVSPIMQNSSDKIYSPTGSWITYLTKHELDFIDKYKLGKYQILDGWWAVPWFERELPKPLHTPISSLLKYKQDTGLKSLLAKRMSTGIYGKFGEERKDSYGIHFNPCWFAEISTQTKLQVADFLYRNGIGARDNEGYRNLIQIGVDGVMLSTPITLPLPDGWRLAYQNEALVVSSGLVYTNTTKPKGLTLPIILDMFQTHPKKGYYQKPIRRRITLGDSIAKGKSWLIGEETDFYSSINFIHPIHDRHFPKLPKNGGQLLANIYPSEPIKINQKGE